MMRGTQLLRLAVSGFVMYAMVTEVFATMSVPNGWYLEANGGSSHLSNVNYNGSISTSGIGGNANLGYKFMPYFGLEIEYTQYANASIKNGSTKAATAKLYSYGLVGRGILPIAASGFELFAKVGAQRLNAHVSINNNVAAAPLGLSSSHHSTTGLYLGAGGQYYITPEFALVAQWQRSEGNSTTGTADLYSAGASFIFD